MSGYWDHMHEGRDHFVYYAYDEYGLLLYVGCTMIPETRWRQHQRSSAWAQYATSFKMFGPYPRIEARELETLAIESEPCYFNVTKKQLAEIRTNWGAARRRLKAMGVTSIRPSDLFDREDAAERAEHYSAARVSMQWQIRDEYPFRTDEDRLNAYLEARAEAAGSERVAA